MKSEKKNNDADALPADLTITGGEYNLEHLYPKFDISQLNPDPDQPRKEFNDEELASLAASIKSLGVLQPLLVRIGADGKVYIVAGERRFKASHLAGLTHVPVIFIDGQNAPVVALVENVLRSDLSTIELSEALLHLKDLLGYSSKRLGEYIGKAESTVSETLTLNNLPILIRDRARGDKNYTRAELLKVKKGSTEDKMIELFEALVKSKAEKVKPENAQKNDVDKTQKTVDSVLKVSESLKDKISALDMSKFNARQVNALTASFELVSALISEKISNTKTGLAEKTTA